MDHFHIFYIEANLVCVIVFSILLFHNHFSIDRQEKQIKYGRALVMFVCYFLADSCWAAIVGGVIPKNRVLVAIDDFALYVFMAGITYFWLEYILAVEQAPNRENPAVRFAVAFPFFAATFVLIINYIAAPGMLLNEELDTMPAFGIYLITVPIIYIVMILLYTMRKAAQVRDPAEKRRHLFIGLFPLMSVIGGLVQQLFFPEIPIYCFACLILMLIFYIQSTESLISLDPLTSLNNRGQLARYISVRSNICPENRLTFVIMMDINGFKGINDTYGHAEGDKALVSIAEALKKVISGYSMPSFLGRYGGDEFIMIIHPAQAKEADQLVREIREEIRRTSEAAHKPYRLSLGIGCDELGDREDVQDCILRADKKLYMDKEAAKRKQVS